MAEIKLFDIDLEGYRNRIQALRSELSQLNKESEDYNQTQRELSNTTNELSNAIASSNPAMSELKNTLQELKTDWANANSEAERGAIAAQIGIIESQMKSMNQELKNTAQDAAAAEGSYNALVVKLRELQQAAKATGDATERMELSKQANEINDQLKGMDAEMGNFQRNVGSYEQSLTNAFGQLAASMGPVAKSTGAFGKVIGGLDGPIKIAVGAIGGLGKAFKALKAAIAANPIGLIVTAVVAASVAIYNHIKSVKAAEEEYKKWKKSLTDISKESKDYAREEQVRSKLLFDAAMKAKQGTDERKRAVEALQKQYPAYFGNMNAELATNEDLQKSYRQLASDILKAAQARARFEKLVDAYRQLDDLEEQKVQLEKNAKQASQNAKKHIKSGGAFSYGGPANQNPNNPAGYDAEDRSAQRALQENSRKIGDVKNSISRLEDGFKTEDLKIDVNIKPEPKGGRGGSKTTKEAEDAFKSLQDAYENFSREQSRVLSNTLEMIEQNIGGIEDFENRVEGSFDETASFEIQQLERQKKANDEYYTSQLIANKQYYDKLVELLPTYQAKLSKAKSAEDKKKIQETIDNINAEIKVTEDGYKLLESKRRKLQYDTAEKIDEQLKKEQEDQLKKIQEGYDARNQNAQNAYDTEIGLAQQRIDDKEALNKYEQQSQLTHLNAEIENEKWYIEQLLQLYSENEPIVRAAKARLTSLEGEAAQLGRKINNPKKEQKDHIKAAIETADAIGSLTGTIADFWKSSTQAQLEAGEITQEEAEKQFEKIKAFEIASAIATTIAGALHSQMSVWKDPTLPLWGKIAMSALLGAETLISGYAQVKQIEATKIGSTTGGTPSITVANATPLLDEAQDVNQLTSLTVSGDSGSNQRVYILQSDIVETTNQNKVRVEQSTF